MRKSDVEIMREVFGKGSRWIGWGAWLQYQPVFKYIAKKVEEGVSVMSTRHFMVSDRRGGQFPGEMIYVDINHRTGELARLVLPGVSGNESIDIRPQSCHYQDKTISEMFDDPWRPTEEELDLFAMLYGDDQILIDMDKEFYATIVHFNKAALKNNLKINFMDS